MSFARAYRELEYKFKARVDLDQHIHGIESVFLPNVKPTGQVDYVLVGMEPGLNAMDLETAKKKIAVCEFENWGRYPQTNHPSVRCLEVFVQQGQDKVLLHGFGPWCDEWQSEGCGRSR